MIHSFILHTQIFTTSHGSAHFRRCMIIELSHQGYSGYGEATEILYYGKDLDRMIALVKSHQTWVELLNIIDPVVAISAVVRKVSF